MQEPLIPGGYILLSRKIIDSEIWQKPPLYLKVWIYLLTAAQHKDYKKLRRGQVRTSIPELIEVCSWKVGYRTERPTKDQIYQILSWLREAGKGVNEADTKATMVTTTRATHGILVNVDNYSLYQDSKNYESNDEGNNDADTMPDNTNKNDKNVKNERKDPISIVFEHWMSKDLVKHKNMNPQIKLQIQFKLSHYSAEELIESIDAYDAILNNPLYKLSTRWGLADFLGKDHYEKFFPDRDPFNFYPKLINDLAPQKQSKLSKNKEKLLGGASGNVARRSEIHSVQSISSLPEPD